MDVPDKPGHDKQGWQMYHLDQKMR